MVEAHPNPKMALSDSKQQLNEEELTRLVSEAKKLSKIIKQDFREWWN